MAMVPEASSSSSPSSLSTESDVVPLIDWIAAVSKVKKRNWLTNRNPDFTSVWTTVADFLRGWKNTGGPKKCEDIPHARTALVDAGRGDARDADTVTTVLLLLSVSLSKSKGLGENACGILVAALNDASRSLKSPNLKRGEKLTAVRVAYRFALRYLSRDNPDLSSELGNGKKGRALDTIVLAYARLLRTPDTGVARAIAGRAPNTAFLLKLTPVHLDWLAKILDAWPRSGVSSPEKWTAAKWAFAYEEVLAMIKGNVEEREGTYGLLVRYATNATIDHSSQAPMRSFLIYSDASLQQSTVVPGSCAFLVDLPVDIFRFVNRNPDTVKTRKFLWTLLEGLGKNVYQRVRQRESLSKDESQTGCSELMDDDPGFKSVIATLHDGAPWRGSKASFPDYVGRANSKISEKLGQVTRKADDINM